MMDGQWGNHNAYSRWLMDWIKPKVIGPGRTTVTLRASGLDADGVIDVAGEDAVAIVPALSAFAGPAPAQEMFLVELRTPTGNDIDVPDGGGVAIWHLAATLDDGPGWTPYDNSYTTPKQLQLLRQGEAEDFPGPDDDGNVAELIGEELFRKNDAFGPDTIPDSRTHDGLGSGIRIAGFRISGHQAEIDIEVAVPALDQGSKTLEPSADNTEAAEALSASRLAAARSRGSADPSAAIEDYLDGRENGQALVRTPSEARALISSAFANRMGDDPAMIASHLNRLEPSHLLVAAIQGLVAAGFDQDTLAAIAAELDDERERFLALLELQREVDRLRAQLEPDVTPDTFIEALFEVLEAVDPEG